MMATIPKSPTTNWEPIPVADTIATLAGSALLESVEELKRSVGRRGMIVLHVELCQGDNGVPLWSTSRVYFEPKRHFKDARERTNDKA